MAFVAPAILAMQAMQTAMAESTFPVYGGVKWDYRYIAARATPLRPADIFRGHLLFIAIRLTMNSAMFLVIAAAFGSIRSTWAIAALPAAVLTGLAFAAPVAAWAITVKRDTSFNYAFRFGMTPLMLFSGTFFPLSQLPGWLRPVAYATPLWHGVALCRSLTLGTPDAGQHGHPPRVPGGPGRAGPVGWARVAIPGGCMPDGRCPTTRWPNDTVPDITVPGHAMPDTTVPDNTVPGRVMPDATVPDGGTAPASRRRPDLRVLPPVGWARRVARTAGGGLGGTGSAYLLERNARAYSHVWLLLRLRRRRAAVLPAVARHRARAPGRPRDRAGRGRRAVPGVRRARACWRCRR